MLGCFTLKKILDELHITVCEGNHLVSYNILAQWNRERFGSYQLTSENWRLYCTDFPPYYGNQTHSGILTIDLYHAPTFPRSV